jgi:alginate O-acetyltransferase complex protein AlgI
VLFNSYTFVVPLACVLAVHHSPLPWRARKVGLLAASYVFYAAWNPPFVVLLWVSTIVDWMVGRALCRTRRPGARRLLLGASLLTNLGLLGWFKYAAFALDAAGGLLCAAGVRWRAPQMDIVLPVGISFYTFQTLSYVFDCYRGRQKAAESLLDFALYLAFFPQLVAGPIVRASEMLPQFASPRRASPPQFGWGACLVVLGLFQKNVLADGMLAPVADAVFGAAERLGTLTAWAGALAFAGQIYCDFAGYSSIAVGLGLCLGFDLPRNFRAPYAAAGFSDFWQRWHVTLSSWFRDYLYIPLGGNRRGALRTAFNVLVTMLLGGLWHGASWTFVFWGGLHGAYLAAERAARAAFARAPAAARMLSGWPARVVTFALVCVAWVFFRAGSFSQAFGIAGAMFGFAPAGGGFRLDRYDAAVSCALVAGIVAADWLVRDRDMESAVARWPVAVRSAWIAAMLAGIAMMPGGGRAFIYFQF